MKTFLLSLLFFPFNAALRGLVLFKLWGWFVVTSFALPPLTVPLVLGLGTLLSFASSRPDFNQAEKPEEEKHGPIALAFLHALYMGLVLLIGYIVHLLA